MKPVTQSTGMWVATLLLLSLLVVGIFIGFAAYSGFSGFPLDDAWIHQVYARNLVQRGEWAFNPGQPSGGSTSPLWSILLGGGYLLGVQPVIWSALLGWFSIFGIAALAEVIIRRWIPAYTSQFPWIGAFFVLEWHLVWAAVSGMETAFFIVIIFAVFWLTQKNERLIWAVGLLIGICTWVRPDGITLLGPVILILMFKQQTPTKRIRSLGLLMGTFVVVFVPYLLFNLHQAGGVWPSTFSAKQAEYQAATNLPILERLWSLFLPFLAGGGVILLPGVLASIVFAWRGRKVEQAAIILWFTGYLLLYALRLPVFYQHGRYMMPAMACYFLVGLWGMFEWMNQWKDTKRHILGGMFWKACLAAVTLVFLFIGGITYRTDVAIIETEMVQTARWIHDNTPQESRLAVHDIGAVGYYSGREVIDLAGLVNPEVIPFIRDETRLEDYLSIKNVQYLVTFPGWYPLLTKDRVPVYQTRGVFSPEAGGENMTVFSWK